MTTSLEYSSISITIMWDGNYWMALFERRDQFGYSAAKATISKGEPQGFQIEQFLNSLDRKKLQFTEPGQEPITTKVVLVEKKLKYEKDRLVEVALKNPFGGVKTLLQKQKNTNKIIRKAKESVIKKEEKLIKDEKLLSKKIEKRKGR
jgi:Protein of unknown function (DUF2992)